MIMSMTMTVMVMILKVDMIGNTCSKTHWLNLFDCENKIMPFWKQSAHFLKKNVHLPIAIVNEELNGTKAPISCPFHILQVINDLKQRERWWSRRQN